jgi:hypothetical protein
VFRFNTAAIGFYIDAQRVLCANLIESTVCWAERDPAELWNIYYTRDDRGNSIIANTAQHTGTSGVPLSLPVWNIRYFLGGRLFVVCIIKIDAQFYVFRFSLSQQLKSVVSRRCIFSPDRFLPSRIYNVLESSLNSISKDIQVARLDSFKSVDIFSPTPKKKQWGNRQIDQIYHGGRSK